MLQALPAHQLVAAIGQPGLQLCNAWRGAIHLQQIGHDRANVVAVLLCGREGEGWIDEGKKVQDVDGQRGAERHGDASCLDGLTKAWVHVPLTILNDIGQRVEIGLKGGSGIKGERTGPHEWNRMDTRATDD